MKLVFNPEDLPVYATGNENAIPLSHLSAESLRQRFRHPPQWTPEVADEHLLSPTSSYKSAAVLIALVMREEGLTLLLTHRAAHLQHHPGQISFPGGRSEAYDLSAVDTALREAQEEIGLERQFVDVIGFLPRYRTATGYDITPVVSLVQPPFELIADPLEVASIFEVPLAFLMDGKNHQRREFVLDKGTSSRSFYSMPYEEHFIWGATAGMLRNLFHLLRA